MARQRHVFDSDMVAHVWAQQSQSEGRNKQGNFYFDGSAIYSYRRGYPVGNIVKGRGGKFYALLWSGRYSNTTSRHQRMAENGARGKFTLFHVPDVLDNNWRPGQPITDIKERNRRHRENVEALTNELVRDLALVRKAAGHPTMRPREYLYRDADYGVAGKARRILRYCEAFGVKAPAVVASFDLETFKSEIAAIKAEGEVKARERRAKLVARYGGEVEADRALDRKYILARASKFRRDSRGLRRLEQGYYVSWKDQDRFRDLVRDLENLARDPAETKAREHLEAFNAAAIAMRERAERAEAERLARAVEAERLARIEREQRAAFAALPDREARLAAIQRGEAKADWLEQGEALEVWRAGGARASHKLWNAPTAMRINGENVETSRGASFPVSHARLAWRMLRMIYASGAAWQTNGHSIKLGHFRIDRVSVDGTVYAGCHVVAREEVERLAAALGLEPVGAWLASGCADCVVSEHAYPLGQLVALGLV